MQCVGTQGMHSLQHACGVCRGSRLAHMLGAALLPEKEGCRSCP